MLAGEVDTTKVGPGVTYYSEYRAAGPWQFDILEVDLTNPWLKIETVTANDELGGHERTSSMANRNDYEGHKVVGAINGDFYDGNGYPIGTQLIEGEFIKTPTDWGSIAFTETNNPVMGFLNYAGSLIIGDSVASINGINRDRLENELILYNHYKGSSTGVNQWGAEFRIKPIVKNSWAANDTMSFVVTEIQNYVGNMILTDSSAVLSGHGDMLQFLNNNAAVGDTVKVVLGLAPALPKLKSLIGGNVILVENGQVASTGVDRHPRTAAGFNADSTKLFLFTVDGRQAGYSVGMTYGELANYMIEWGVHSGINLDGGGSTTMLVRKQIKNSPSDAGGERSVSNSLQIISTAPTGPLGIIDIVEKEIFLLGGKKYKFNTRGYDEYYNPVSFSSSELVWSCDESLGLIDETGYFTAANDTLSGYVYVDYNGLKDSAIVRITRVSEITIEPDPVVLQKGQYQQMTASAVDNLGNTISLAQTDYTWSVTNNLGTISATGYFHATAEGEGQIFAEYGDVHGGVNLSIGVSQYIVIDNFNDPDNYALSGLRVDLDNCNLTASNEQYVSPPTSGKLEYSLTTGGTSVLYLDCSIQVSGTPDKVGLSIYGDAKGHWLRSEFADVDGEKFLLNFTNADPGINWTGEWQYIEKELAEAEPSWANPSATMEFPITWTRLYLAETDENSKDSGVLYLDDFKVHFITTNVEDNNLNTPADFKLFNNYPNPFNPSTKIRFSVPEKSNVELRVFNSLGEEVAEVINREYSAGNYEVSFDASKLSSGVYFYQMKAGNFISTNKMILMK